MDYYEVLGIHKNASKIEIRKAYHKLAIIWHPDKNNSSDAKIKFQKISEAYQVLYNEKSRSEYDLSGRTDFKMKSPEDLFNELFNNVDPVISRFLKNTFSDIKDKFNNSEKVNLWELFTNIDKDTLIEEGGNVVKHILKKSLTDNDNLLVDKKYTYELKLNIEEIDIVNTINLTLDCVRRYTHINILIPNDSGNNNSYILEILKLMLIISTMKIPKPLPLYPTYSELLDIELKRYPELNHFLSKSAQPNRLQHWVN